MYSIDFRFVSKLLDIKKFLTKVINMKKILITTSTFGLKEAKGSHILEQNGYQVILNPFERKLKEEELLSLADENC